MNASIKIKGKCTSVIIDTCRKTTIIFETCMGSCEAVNSVRLHVWCIEKVPSVAIDKTDGIVLHLPLSSLDTEVIASKSSEMNISWPDENDEIYEKPIPEQFKYKLIAAEKKIIAEVSDLY